MRISDWSSDVCSSDLHEIDVLDIAAVGLDAGTFRQLDHLHAVMLRRRGLLADIGHAGETGLVPDRHAIAIAHQMLRQFALAEVAAVGVERDDLEIGRASCRERVGPYVLISGVAVYLKKKIRMYNHQ